jgi:putative heme-binding domain-containing protein
LQDVGNEVGPDLTALSNKTPQYLLIEILAPNKNVDTRYIEYVALTKNGRTFTGILASESATSITLRGQEGKEQVLLRSELEELQSSGKSMMPEGLEKDLSKQDLADLIAYVAGGGR